jgi:citrate synthase
MRSAELQQVGGTQAGVQQGTAAAGGLEGVVVADTCLSEVDGEAGRLVIAGEDVERLAGRAPFEDVALRLLLGRLPSEGEVAGARAALGRARVAAHALLPGLGGALEAADGMDALRGALGQLREAEGAAGAAFPEEALRLVGAVGVFATAWARRREGLPPLVPEAGAAHAEDLLRLATGARAEEARWRALEAYLVTVSDHGLNASTFAARVVASTGSDAVSALVAGVGALKGPLHGGAPGPVLDMLDAIGAPERAEAWLEGELAAGRRLMGMGHRIYRVRDPRAAVLERALERLEAAGVVTPRLGLARAVERAAEGVLRARHPTRPLHANVEFYTAVLLDALGLPRALFAPLFASSRAVGWMAHVQEQRRVGRLIRPASRYVGPRAEAVAA